jgi:hypothetical protein
VLVNAYDFTVNGGSYTFNAPVTLTFVFDPSKIPAGMTPAVEYYDNTTGQWVLLQGTVTGDAITATVNHFTDFAMIAVPQTASAPAASVTSTVSTCSDVPSSYWGYGAIASLSGKGTISPGKFPAGRG